MIAHPPAPETLPRQQPPDTTLYAEMLQKADEVQPLIDSCGRVYAWLPLPSRCTVPVWHENRPAPTPGCGCAPCARPRCCGTWAEPVTLSTGETVAWVSVLHRATDGRGRAMTTHRARWRTDTTGPAARYAGQWADHEATDDLDELSRVVAAMPNGAWIEVVEVTDGGEL